MTKLRFIFLLPELVLLFFFVAPMYKHICNPGNLFGTAVCALLLFVTMFPKKTGALLGLVWAHIAGKIGLSVLAACVAAGIVFCSVMSVQMGRAITNRPETPHTVVVLGCKVRGTTPSAMLLRRLEAALEYLEEHEDVMCITAGGQGAGEDLAEGIVMRQWLVEHGIAEDRILAETDSTDTRENIQNTAKILEAYDLGNEIVLVTDGFHQYRASLLAKEAGLTAFAYSAYTNPLYVPTYWVREWMGLLEFFAIGG